MNPIFFNTGAMLHGRGGISFSELERAPDILKYTFFYPISVIFIIMGIALIFAAVRVISEIKYDPVMSIIMFMLFLACAFLTISFGALTIISTAGFL